jgi:hypothetical protein
MRIKKPCAAEAWYTKKVSAGKTVTVKKQGGKKKRGKKGTAPERNRQAGAQQPGGGFAMPGWHGGNVFHTAIV